MQCEGCHGPGSEYANEQTMRDKAAAMKAGLRMPNERRCLVCHIDKGRTRRSEIREIRLRDVLARIAHPRSKEGQRRAGAGGEDCGSGEGAAADRPLACGKCHEPAEKARSIRCGE